MKHPIEDTVDMKKYLFSVQTTVEVSAANEEDAYELLNDGKGETTDRDVLLVLVEDADNG